MKILSEFFAKLFAGRLFGPAAFLSALRSARAIEEAGNNEARFMTVPDDGPLFDAPARLQVGKTFFTSVRYLSLQERADYQFCDPRILRFAGALVATLRKQRIPLYVHGAFRTRAEQDAAVAAGRSRAVWPRAAHCQGAAVDIVHARYHWDMSPNEWALIGKVGKDVADRLGLEIVWGGDWEFYDPAHWELAGWKANVRAIPDGGPPVRRTAFSLVSQRF